MWLCVLHGGGDANLAAAVPVSRPRAAAGFHIVGSRPIPAGASRQSLPPAFRFTDDKRPIPSCPDALHNR
ncbi:hypothetical protein PR202_gb26556 [Eleusine coracana subsp. coracana]|uniref:Uncharacterized protein n=1 Tax=Eleusine coracana subsp. coracana TaxID=191504 RepID=A0AAV5FS66_ELECO|nr:hypothetical protein PR202_gb26556 [Eleusine coracana subsp. coracana]